MIVVSDLNEEQSTKILTKCKHHKIHDNIFTLSDQEDSLKQKSVGVWSMNVLKS